MVASRMPYLSIGGTTLPPLNVVLPLEVTIGRSDPSAQPDANSLSFTYTGPTMPSYIRRGAEVSLSLGAANPDEWMDEWEDEWTGQTFGMDLWTDIWSDIWSGAGSNGQRFRGRVADVAVSPVYPGQGVTADIVCIGLLSDLADQIVGDEPWPAEPDQSRILRLARLIRGDAVLSPEGSTVLRLRRRDVDRRKMLELLHLFGGSVGSILWEYPDGSLHYQGIETRQVPQTWVYLPPQGIVADVEWSQTTDQLIDRARVEYGDDPEGADRPTYIAGDGYHETKVGGEVADLPTAKVVGDTIVERWGRTDLWDAPQVVTRNDLLDEAAYDGVLSLMPSDALLTGNLPPIPTPGTEAAGLWFVEGWTETWDRHGINGPLVHEFKYAVSDVRRFAVSGEVVPLLLTVTPTNIVMGPGTMTAIVRRTDGGPLPEAGVLSLIVDGYEPAYPVDLAAYSGREVTFTVALAQFPPGPRAWHAAFSGVPHQYRPSLSNVVQTVVQRPAGGYTQVTLNVTTTLPHVGDIMQLTAHVFPVLDSGEPAKGTLEFQADFYPYDGMQRVGDIINVSGKAMFSHTMSWYVPRTPEVRWWAVFTADEDQGGAATGSAQVLVQPVEQVAKTVEYVAEWTGHYREDGTLIDRTALRQGDHGDGEGDTRSIVSYPIDAAAWQGHTVTKVEAYLFVGQWSGGEVGTVRVGSWSVDPTGQSVPPYVPPDEAPDLQPTILHRTDVSGWVYGTAKYVDITPWGRSLLTETIEGIAVGPADRETVGYAGTLQGLTGANPPKVRFTGYRWAKVLP